MKTILSFFAATLFLTGCYTTTDYIQNETVERIAAPMFMNHDTIKTDPFHLTSYTRVYQSNGSAVIYIEGEGHHYGRRNVGAPHDPTPVYPMALHLAAHDLTPNVVYLARPCQYSGDETQVACPDRYKKYNPEQPRYANEDRFSPVVIASYMQALDILKRKHGFTGYHLVGYSGGGTIATYLASMRDDVHSLRTVAGILDTDRFAADQERLTLTDPVNPVEIAPEIKDIPQQHFVGEWDDIITRDYYDSFANAMGLSECRRGTYVFEATHDQGWVNIWPHMLKRPLDCAIEIDHERVSLEVDVEPPLAVPPGTPVPLDPMMTEWMPPVGEE